MARETKVGLLAGLAFIICFAILLTNRGRHDLPLPAGSILTSGATDSTLVRQAASQVSPQLPAPEPRTPRDRAVLPASGASESSVANLDVQRSEPYATNGAELVLSDTHAVKINPPASPLSSERSDLFHQPSERALTSRTPDDLEKRLELERRLRISEPDSSTNGIQSSQVAPPSAIPNALPTQRAPVKLVSYTVLPGDTLSKIALAHLGNKSQTSVNAIFDANRATLASPNDLKAGLVLSVPVADAKPAPPKPGPVKENIAAPVKHAATPAKNDAAPTKISAAPVREEGKSRANSKSNEPPPATRWYQVKKNDRYASIAREQLGDTTRWREVYELNKDKFPNAQTIREGVRIKLPAAKGLASAEGRR